MAWMWWLLTPVVLTVLGSSAIGWHGLAQRRRSAGAHLDPVAEHAAFLAALPKPAVEQPLPLTIVVTDLVDSDS